MPTGRGWLVVSLGVAVGVVGRVFGARPVEQVAFALIVLVLVAIAVVRLGRHEVTVSRRVTPERARAGRSVAVSLEVANDGVGPAPLLLLEDSLPHDLPGTPRFTLPGLEPEGRRKISYEVTPARRGRYRVGPLRIAFSDPFGLAQLRTDDAPATAFLVHPRIEPLALPRDLGERRSLAVSALRQLTGLRGEDFYTLREYTEGDDLRKIHWPSTAKRQKYMIRQEETPWHNRATIVIDDRWNAHDGAGDQSSFERSVEVAASLVDLYSRSGYNYRLAGALHPGLPNGRGSQHLHLCLDLLATIRAERASDDPDPLVVRLVEIEAKQNAEGTMVLVAGTLTPESAVALARCRRRFRQVIAVTLPAHRFGSGATKDRWAGEQQTLEIVRLLSRSGVRVLVLGPGESIAHAWDTLSAAGRKGGEGRWDRRPELV